MLAVIEDDLMFLSRIREAAKAAGVEVTVARGAAALVAACAAGANVVLANLDSPRLQAIEAVGALRSDGRFAALPVTGYLSHVHAERAEAARAAGFDRVLARSAFVQALPSLLEPL
jgi:CheY-like chemotaxis protein